MLLPRSAIVWESAKPGNATSGNSRQRMQSKAKQAASNAMVTFASGNRLHQSSSSTISNGISNFNFQGYRKVYRQYAPDGEMSDKYLFQKYQYAHQHTIVKIERSSNAPDAELTAIVTYNAPFHIPFIGRILGKRPYPGATYFATTIESRATLQSESPRNDNWGTWYRLQVRIKHHMQYRHRIKSLLHEIFAGEVRDNKSRSSLKNQTPVKGFQKIAICEEGTISMVTIVAVLVIAILIGFVGNSGRVVQQKIEVQNAADSVAYSSALWQARGMNAITAVNHLLGEATAICVLIEAIGGPELEKARSLSWSSGKSDPTIKRTNAILTILHPLTKTAFTPDNKLSQAAFDAIVDEDGGKLDGKYLSGAANL